MARPGKYLRTRRGTARASAALLLALALPAAARPAASAQRRPASSGETRPPRRWHTWPQKILSSLKHRSLKRNSLQKFWIPDPAGASPKNPPPHRGPLVAKVGVHAFSLSDSYFPTVQALTWRLPGGDTVSVVVDGENADGSGDAAAATAAINGFRAAFEKYAETQTDATPEAALIAAIRATDQELRQGHDARFASITAVFHRGNRATVASVGGGAALLVRRQKATPLTASHERAQRNIGRSPRLGEGVPSRSGLNLTDDFSPRIEGVKLEPGDRIVLGSPGLGQIRGWREESVIQIISKLIGDHDVRAPDTDFAPLLAKRARSDSLERYGTARDVAVIAISFSAPAQE